jgi:hypothetical protein
VKASYVKIVATVLVAIGITGAASASSWAYTWGFPPGLVCTLDGEGALKALENSMSPANGATLPAGVPVTFSGEAKVPVTFSVASSAALLSTPDIDGGPASVQSGSSVYTFTSAKATVMPQTVYWTASFSSAEIPSCTGQPLATYTAVTRTLTIVPNVTQERKSHEEQEQKSREEKEAKERSEGEAVARKAKEAREAKARSCVVPTLEGDSLAKAQHALARAHCRLGRVTRPRGRHVGALVITRQSPRAGSQHVGGTRVGVTLGLVTAHKRR